MNAPPRSLAQVGGDHASIAIAEPPEFATFWHGKLNAIAYGCLASFAHFGARLRLYAYDGDIDLPPGVEWADARRICADESLVSRYIAAGKPSLAMFADMFRYKLVRETGLCWVDTDLICLKKPDLRRDSIVFGRQSEAHGKALINNAVLRLPPSHPLLAELIRRAEDAVDIDQSWGAIGPFLLTELAERQGIDQYARDLHHFYPIEPDHFWMPFLPEYCGAVAEAAQDATFLHLWSELIARLGYDKTAAPPVGSFLHNLFARFGTLGRFERVYDQRELRDLVAEWTRNSPGPTIAPRGD